MMVRIIFQHKIFGDAYKTRAQAYYETSRTLELEFNIVITGEEGK